MRKKCIPLLWGPMIETIAYESPHSANFIFLINLSIPVALNTPSPSMS